MIPAAHLVIDTLSQLRISIFCIELMLCLQSISYWVRSPSSGFLDVWPSGGADPGPQLRPIVFAHGVGLGLVGEPPVTRPRSTAHRSCSVHMPCRGACLRPLLTAHRSPCCCQPDSCYLTPCLSQASPARYFFGTSRLEYCPSWHPIPLQSVLAPLRAYSHSLGCLLPSACQLLSASTG